MRKRNSKNPDFANCKFEKSKTCKLTLKIPEYAYLRKSKIKKKKTENEK